jgi:hypothetical protein
MSMKLAFRDENEMFFKPLRRMVAVLAVFVLVCAVVAGCTPPTAPTSKPKCVDIEKLRVSVWWPTLDGTPECPLPADHPRCLSGEEKDCTTAVVHNAILISVGVAEYPTKQELGLARARALRVFGSGQPLIPLVVGRGF